MSSDNNSTYTGDPAHPIKMVRYIHPSRDAAFRATAPSKAETRDALHAAASTCSQCFKIDKIYNIKLLKCARCQSVWYCSKKCQKENWSVHKIICSDVERGHGKLTKAFLVNPILSLHLQVCLCLEFGLVEKPAPDTPYMARVDIGIEPSDITIFFQLYFGMYGNSKPEPERIEGMLQINRVTCTSQASPEITPHPHRLAAWREARKIQIANGQASTPVINIEFKSNDTFSAFSAPLEISPIALSMAKKKKPFEIVSVINGNSFSPMSAASCLEAINSYIRSDTKNQLFLRMDMRQEDKDVIQAAGKGEETTAVSILKEKMAREERRYRVYPRIQG